jgi:type I restriction enzyme S subunit
VSDLPPGWGEGTLGEFASPERVAVAPADYPDLPFLGLESVEAQTTKILGTEPSSSVRSTSYRFISGSTLYARLRPYLNKVCTPAFEGLGSGEFIIFPPSPQLAPGFLKYLLNQPRFVRFTATLDTGDRPRVNWDRIRRFECALPPRAEQERIVVGIEELFSRIDAGWAALEAAANKSVQLTKAIIVAAIPEQIPPGWETTTVGEAGTVQLGRQRSKSFITAQA